MEKLKNSLFEIVTLVWTYKYEKKSVMQRKGEEIRKKCYRQKEHQVP